MSSFEELVARIEELERETGTTLDSNFDLGDCVCAMCIEQILLDVREELKLEASPCLS